MTITVTGDAVVNDPGAAAPEVNVGQNGQSGTVVIADEALVTTQGVNVGNPISTPGEISPYPSILSVDGTDGDTLLRVYGSLANTNAQINIGAGSSRGYLNISAGAEVQSIGDTAPAYGGGYEPAQYSAGQGAAINIGTDGGRGTLTVTGANSQLLAAGGGDRDILIGSEAGSYAQVSVTDGGSVRGSNITIGDAGGAAQVTISDANSEVAAIGIGSSASMQLAQAGGTAGVVVTEGGRLRVVSDQDARFAFSSEIGNLRQSSFVNLVDNATLEVRATGDGDADLLLGESDGRAAIYAQSSSISVTSASGYADLELGSGRDSYGRLLLLDGSTLDVTSGADSIFGFGNLDAEVSVGAYGDGSLGVYSGSQLTISGDSAGLSVGARFQQGQGATVTVYGGTIAIESSETFGGGAVLEIQGGPGGEATVTVLDQTAYNYETSQYDVIDGQITLGGNGGGAGILTLGGDDGTLTIANSGEATVYAGDIAPALVVVGGVEDLVNGPYPGYYNYYGFDEYGAEEHSGSIFVTGEGSILTIGATGYGGAGGDYPGGLPGGPPGGLPGGPPGGPASGPFGGAFVRIGGQDNTEGLIGISDGGTLDVLNNGVVAVGYADGSEGQIVVTGEGSVANIDGLLLVGGSVRTAYEFVEYDEYNYGAGFQRVLSEFGGGEGILFVGDGGVLNANEVFVGRNGIVSLEGEVSGAFDVHGEFAVGADEIEDLSLAGDLNFLAASRIFIDISDFDAGVGDHILLDGDARIDSRQSFFVVEIDVASDVTEGEVFTFLTATGDVDIDTRLVFDVNRGLSFELGSDGTNVTLTALETSIGVVPVIEVNEFEEREGGNGREELISLFGDATLIGNGGDDTLTGALSDVLSGGLGDDLIVSGGTNTRIFAGQGDDTIRLSDETDFARGGDGDDLFEVVNGIGNLDGGDDIDTLSFANLVPPPENVNGNVQFDLLGLQETLGVNDDGFANGFENLIGTKNDDTLLGDNEANVIDGGRGGDSLVGRDGDDLLIGDKGVDTLDGGEDDDTLDGGAQGDLLIGGGGTNVLIGGLGADTLQGSALGFDIASFETSTREVARALGEDEITAFGDARLDTFIEINGLRGSAFDDTLGGGGLDNLLEGGAGDDQLFGFGGQDTLRGEAGDDTLDGGEGGDVLDGGDDNDSVDGGLGTDTVRGNDGDDTLSGGFDNVNDFIEGGLGNDLIFAATGDLMAHGIDSINGGDGQDTLTFENETLDVKFDLAGTTTNAGAGLNSDVSEVEHVIGGAGADQLRGDGEANRLVGGEGIDRLIGRDGDDTLEGGNGNDLLRGGNDDDLLLGGESDDTLQGEDGADTLIGGAGADSLVGGNSSTFIDEFEQVVDRDVASYESAGGRVRVDLTGGLSGIGDAAGDQFDGIEDLTGSDFNDTLFGDDLANILDGGDDNDFLRGKGGEDTILGGDGLDTIRGDGGSDDIRSGAGDDFVKAGDGSDTVEGGAGADTLYGGDDNGVDHLTYESSAAGVDVSLLSGVVSGGDAEGDRIVGFESLTGSQQVDRLEGDGSDNDLNGLDGADVILGRGGTDRIDGGDGNDTISAGGGADDFIVGGGGADVLLGNGGNDAFVFEARTDSGVGDGQRDVIRDFSEAQGDTIDFTEIAFTDENGGFTDTQQIAFAGSSFTGTAGDIIANVVDNDFTLIQIDFDGDQQSDFEIEVDGVHANIQDSFTFDFI